MPRTSNSVKIKSKEQLIKEGWRHGKFRHVSQRGLVYGTAQNPEAYISYWEEVKVLGKNVQIIEAKLEGSCPKFRVQLDDYTTWVSWHVFEKPPGTRRPNTPGVEIKSIKSGEKIYYFEHTGKFKFDCGYRTLSSKDLVKIMKWAAKLLGYKVTKK